MLDVETRIGVQWLEGVAVLGRLQPTHHRYEVEVPLMADRAKANGPQAFVLPPQPG